ncbi:C-C motif chemokine 20a.3 [Labeo rohita]|uniref:C-C motif chemokine 20a.3 n=1 Tax=Labeo rohita TaxID=84645 RepID=UPI0021E29F86|nr:C-C motif chemokine 20a.3 [Labeo rohita]
MTRTSVTVIVLLVAALSVLCKDASALSCCRKYTRGKIPMSIIRGYSIQTIKRNCHIDAVIFHTKGGKEHLHRPLQTLGDGQYPRAEEDSASNQEKTFNRLI